MAGQLLSCHERIREMTALASQLASEPRAPNDEIADTADRVRRYFVRSLPNHERDEEESILPRLEKRSPELAAHLARMRAEHAEHRPHVKALVSCCEVLEMAPQEWENVRGELREHAAKLKELFAVHLEEEERDIFPHLKFDDEDAVLAEMSARREGGGGGGGRRRG